MKKDKKKIEFEKYSIKDKLFISCLTGIAFSFVLCLFGPVDIYANNMQEFAFTFKDIIAPVLILFIIGAVAISGILMLFQRFILNILSALPFALIFSSIIYDIIYRKPRVVSGDISEFTDSEYRIIISIFAICFFVLMMISVVMTKKWKSVIAFLCVLLVGMNGASLVSDFVNKDLIHDNSVNCDYVLSKMGIDEVSEKENVIYILFDRFDNRYVKGVQEKYPEFFDDLEGFTYFDSAVSKYTRTFPGVPYMLSGNEFKAETSAPEYLDTTYKNSSFLKDVKDNGYNINIYADRYYEYTDASAFEGIADNVREVTLFKANKTKIATYLLNLSFARIVKFTLAQVMYDNANLGLASELSTFECEGGTYHDNDAWFSDFINENELKYSGNDKNFTFLYLHGCHTPYILDENGDVSDGASDISQVIGSFKSVKKYLEYLKKIGVYDNSTIIISGDHGDPNEETQPLHGQIEEGVTTAIMIKPRNAKNEKLVKSSAQVSVSDIIPTIVKDANIKTDKNYGESAFDIKENEERTRIFYQSVYDINEHKLGLNKYEIKGNAHDIKNWKLTDKIRSEYAWY